MKRELDEFEMSTDPEYHQNRLRELISQMTEEEYAIFLKYIQLRSLEELLDSMKNLKQTGVETWSRVMNKLRMLLAFDVPKDIIDMRGFIKALLPLVGALAAACLAMKAADKAAADADVDEKFEGMLEDIAKAQEDSAPESVILAMCKENTNGFTE